MDDNLIYFIHNFSFIFHPSDLQQLSSTTFTSALSSIYFSSIFFIQIAFYPVIYHPYVFHP